MEHSLMIEAKDLSKFYGSFAAIRNVNFSVHKGQVTAFLGPNGAGKSTTLKILTGYLSPSAGAAKIAGLDVSCNRIEAAAHVGYLPENGPLYPEMTPKEFLEFMGHARGLVDQHLHDRMEAVIGQCNLESVAEKSIYKLSKGYRQRIGMAQVLLHEPDILIMDEPTSGLDPNQICDVRELVRELGKTKTILISTHILQEVTAVADQVIVIDEGCIVFDGTPDEMTLGATLEDAFYRLTDHNKRSMTDVASHADSQPHTFDRINTSAPPLKANQPPRKQTKPPLKANQPPRKQTKPPLKANQPPRKQTKPPLKAKPEDDPKQADRSTESTA
jgi:ABC-2 type transport system ATP-binding protein